LFEVKKMNSLNLKDISYVILFGIIIVIILLTLNHVFAAEKHYQLEQITVHQGDTLWTLANDYYKQLGMSKQEYIHHVQKVNQLDNHMVFPGQALMMPVPEQSVIPNGKGATWVADDYLSQ